MRIIYVLINDYLKEGHSGNNMHTHTHVEESVQCDYVKQETKGLTMSTRIAVSPQYVWWTNKQLEVENAQTNSDLISTLNLSHAEWVSHVERNNPKLLINLQ